MRDVKDGALMATAARRVDVLDYHLCWGGSSDLGLCQVMDKGTPEETCTAPESFHSKYLMSPSQ